MDVLVKSEGEIKKGKKRIDSPRCYLAPEIDALTIMKPGVHFEQA